MKTLQDDLEEPSLSLEVSIYQGAVKRISGSLVDVSDGFSVYTGG